MASFQELQQLVEGGARKHVRDVRRDCTKTITLPKTNESI